MDWHTVEKDGGSVGGFRAVIEKSYCKRYIYLLTWESEDAIILKQLTAEDSRCRKA